MIRLILQNSHLWVPKVLYSWGVDLLNYRELSMISVLNLRIVVELYAKFSM